MALEQPAWRRWAWVLYNNGELLWHQRYCVGAVVASVVTTALAELSGVFIVVTPDLDEYAESYLGICRRRRNSLV